VTRFVASLFIESRRIEHDGSRRVIATGKLSDAGAEVMLAGTWEDSRALRGALLAGRRKAARQQRGGEPQ